MNTAGKVVLAIILFIIFLLIITGIVVLVNKSNDKDKSKSENGEEENTQDTYEVPDPVISNESDNVSDNVSDNTEQELNNTDTLQESETVYSYEESNVAEEIIYPYEEETHNDINNADINNADKDILFLSIKGDTGEEKYNLIVNEKKIYKEAALKTQPSFYMSKMEEPLKSVQIDFVNDGKTKDKRDKNIRIVKLEYNGENLLNHMELKNKKLDENRKKQMRNGVFAWGGTYLYKK